MGMPDVGAVGGAALGGVLGGVGGYLLAGGSFGGDDGFDFRNPGQINLSELNPELYAIYKDRQDTLNKFRPILEDSLNEDTYNARVNRARTQAETGTLNSYARAGMAGSSVGLNAANDNSFRAEEAIRNGRMNDILRGLQAEEGIQNNLRGDLQMGQQGFAQYQQQLLSAYLGEQATSAQTTSALIGAAGTIAGAAIAGPPGAMIGSNMASVASSYKMPEIGSSYMSSQPAPQWNLGNSYDFGGGYPQASYAPNYYPGYYSGPAYG